MESWITLSAVITPITENTPMVTPSMVRPERSLLVFSAPSAMRMISWKFIAPHPVPLRGTTLSPLTRGEGLRSEGASFVPQCLDRIQSRGRESGRESRDDSRDRRHHQTRHDQSDREAHRKGRECRRDRGRHQPREKQSDRAADETDRDRFDEELQQNRSPPRADGLARADLARALLHADIGDVHDADRADEESQPGHEKPRHCDAALDRTERAAQRALLIDLEIVGLLRTQSADAAHVADQLVLGGL